MTRFALCSRCGERIMWVECPTGGWWAHVRHPEDEHDAEHLGEPGKAAHFFNKFGG